MMILSGLVVFILVIVDQWVKWLTVLNLKNSSDVTIVKGIFELTYVENRGAAFGMLQDKIWIFALFTVIILGAMIVIYVILPKTKKYYLLRGTMVLLFSGAVGNFIDRVRIGFVVDMFHFYWFEFPVFNVADIYVVVSCGILIFLMLFYYKEEDLDFKKMVHKNEE